uniref:Uncharacterized protein n=1 Tax=Zosterops lateralis melanops TaxID=1220523 RepID=A0A8D2P369_ZOSLA
MAILAQKMNPVRAVRIYLPIHSPAHPTASPASASPATWSLSTCSSLETPK